MSSKSLLGKGGIFASFLLMVVLGCQHSEPERVTSVIVVEVAGVRISDSLDEVQQVLGARIDPVATTHWRKKNRDFSHQVLSMHKPEQEFLFNQNARCCLIFSESVKLKISGENWYEFKVGDDIASLSGVLKRFPVRKEVRKGRPFFIHHLGRQKLIIYTEANRSYFMGRIPLKERALITGFHVMSASHDPKDLSNCELALP